MSQPIDPCRPRRKFVAWDFLKDAGFTSRGTNELPSKLSTLRVETHESGKGNPSSPFRDAVYKCLYRL